MKKLKVFKGFTLVELIIIITILSIVLSVIYGIFISVYKSNIRADAENEAMNDLRITMMNMQREIREAKELKIDKIAGDKMKISFDAGVDNVYYRIKDNRLEKSSDDTNWIILIPMVQKIASNKYFEISSNNKNILIKMIIFDEKNNISSGIEINSNFVPRSKGVVFSDF